MADNSTCVNEKRESSVTDRDESDGNDSSSSSDYLYITCSPGNSKFADFSDDNVSEEESDHEYQDDEMVEESEGITDPRSEASYQHEISEKLYRLKMENEFLKEQMSQVIEIFDDEGYGTNSPLVQVSFSHHFLALNYKSKIEAYLCSLLTSEKGSDISDCEDKSDRLKSDSLVPVGDSGVSKELFFLENSIDDKSCCSIPLYDNKYEGTLDNTPKNILKPKPSPRNLPSCFNCLGNHRLSECPEEHNKDAIAVNKKIYYNKQASRSRSNTVDTRRTRLFTAGVISDELRKALDLESNQLPLYIYHMRLLGYPPGWMKEAEVNDSELKMYDSEGKIILDGTDCQSPLTRLPKVDDGGSNMEASAPDNGLPKVKYDPSLLIDYPGFNIPTPLGFIDESKELGMPAIQFHQLRCVAELKMASPGKMPYRKRKLPSSAEVKRQRLDTSSLEDMETESLDMEIESLDNGEGRIIDSDDDDAKLCQFIPPLPPEEPNHVPSPPPLPIPLPTFQDEAATVEEQSGTQSEVTTEQKSEMLPVEESITDKQHEVSSGKGASQQKQDELSSITLKDLEETKQKLLSELRNLWVTAATKDMKRHNNDKDGHHRDYKGTCRECRYTWCRGCRDTHSHQKKEKKRKKKDKKQVPRLIVVGDCTCNKLNFDGFAKKNHHIEVLTGDHWKLQTAMFHLKTKDLVVKGNEILIVHLGINDLQLLKGNGSLNEIKKYAERFIEQTVKQVKLLIISAILPSTFFSTTVNYKIQCANVFIRELCKKEGVNFLNARKAFMTNGKLDEEFFQKDKFTLNSKGSEKLSRIFYSCFENAILRLSERKAKQKQKKRRGKKTEEQPRTEANAQKEQETEAEDRQKQQETEKKTTKQSQKTKRKDMQQEKDPNHEQSFIEWFG